MLRQIVFTLAAVTNITAQFYASCHKVSRVAGHMLRLPSHLPSKVAMS